jgi:Fic family protein
MAAESALTVVSTLGRFRAPCELPLPTVVWEPDKEAQVHEWREFVNTLPQRISEVRQLGSFATEFGKKQLALFIFDSNRLKGITTDHAEGTTMATISTYLDGTGAVPDVERWDSEGGRELSSPSSNRQLFQACTAANFLLRENVERPLTTDLICQTHRLLFDGSWDTITGQPSVAGRFRREGEEVFASQRQCTPSASVVGAVDCLIIDYERMREAGDHPIKLATFLFFTLVSIHPFGNGNGRVSRFLFAWSLLRDGFPFPVVLSSGHHDSRRHYMRAIMHAQGSQTELPHFGELNVTALVSMRRVLDNITTNARLAGLL